ncbi:ABC transporter permease [Cryobacterium sinapicolor]|uniref:ABC transporter permease n=1 Tax=Cryobacterium sinapicolor TaxID=1259236 RepID=A0ABY2IYA8_9MICO|nr:MULTISPECIES: ABC transporter permease [Cryobacterium]TFC89924.1 ABC transporter permease [Cryobacterium sp. TMT3-29-2]TFC96401.1 ABC transporter permease [Cryobacterium sinapicolor]
MNAANILTAAIANSLRSKLRTVLTVVAIVIGAFTLTITSAIGTGVSNYIETQIGAFGAKDVLSVTKATDDTGQGDEGPAPYDPDDAIVGAGFAQFDAEALTEEDLAAIRAVEGIVDVSAVQQVNPRYAEYDGHGKFILGVNDSATLTTPDLSAGAPLDNSGGEPQILLVTSYVDALGFADEQAAIGKTIQIGVVDYLGEMHEVNATVAGIQNETILATGAALNQALLDELHTTQSVGRPQSASEGAILATARFDANATDEQVDDIQTALAGKGFAAATVADQIGIIQTVVDAIVALLNAFAVIALIAAGFGIINTLLMSVQERTREIGLMKAMGMGAGRIYALFSAEAVFIGFLGSVLGAGAAIAVGTAANGLLAGTFLADLEGLQVLRFEVAPVATIILIVMAIAFLAGTLPARRAARQNPIEALRYE